MLKRWFLLVIMMLAMVAFTGCSDDDDDPITPPSGDTAFDVMVAAGKAYINDSADCPGVISAQAVFDNFDDYTIIDVRGASDYLNGHIQGAYNTSWGTFLDDLANNIPTGKPYVITCYTGQSAGHYKVAAEMMGYDDVYSLLWGMSSWNSNVTGSNWEGSAMVTDALGAANAEQTNNNGDLVEHDFPVLTESASTVVADRVEAMLAAGFQSTSYTAIQDNLDDYFVLNYFGEADYMGTGGSGVPGHIPGAFQFTPYASLGDDQMLNNLPSDGTTIVVYCWTGQHSSQVTAYLNMLGYNAKSMAYGSNNLFHSSLTGHKWSSANVMDFPLEMGPMMTGDFAALVDAGDDYINSADCPGYIFAQELYDNLDDYTVVDIRSQEHFDYSHIAGAYRVNAVDLLDSIGDPIPTGKTFALVCYSGQTASYYKALMELAGHGEVKFLFMGMSTWNSDVLGTNWATTSMVANELTNPETTNNNGDLVWNSYPATTGTLSERVDAVSDAGFQTITYSAIEDYLDDYFVLNYFGVADYEGTGTAGVPGHIPGAFQFTPKASLGAGQMLGNLPSDGTPIVVYCWTGQHGAQVTAYLNMLGYNAKSLVYGSNNLFHDSLVDSFKKWDPSFVTGLPMVGTFDDPVQ
jgi:rhodanese-related sulfurtransferase